MKQDRRESAWRPTQMSRRLDPWNTKSGDFKADTHRKAIRRAQFGPSDRFVLDTELTGLRSEMVYNADVLAFQRDVRSFFGELNVPRGVGRPLGEKITAFKALKTHAYFHQIGMMQMGYVEANKAFRAPFGFGFSYPGKPAKGPLQAMEQTFGMASSGEIRMSTFSLQKGIIARSIDAIRSGETGDFGAKSELERVMDFTQHLTKKFDAGKKVRWSNWNVGFDAGVLQTRTAMYAKEVADAGLNPFLLMEKYAQGDLILDSSEEFFFDLLRTKGIMDPQYASRNFRFGKHAISANESFPGMFQGIPGVAVGGQIDLLQDLNRRAAGQTSFLRSRYGWKLEEVGKFFGRYSHLNAKRQAVINQLNLQNVAHEAIFDSLMADQIAQRSRVASRLAHKYALGGIENPLTLAMGKAGILGEEYSGRGMGVWKYAQYMSSPEASHQMAELASRETWFWGAQEKWTRPAISQSQAIGRTVEAQSKVNAGRLARMAGGFAPPRAWVSNPGTRFGVSGGAIAAVAGAAGAALMYSALHKNKRINANVPGNYHRGQQSHTKAVDVPWASPWEGSDQDTTTTTTQLLHLAPLGIPFVLQQGFGFLPRKWQQATYAVTRWAEDITPFRIGRIFGLSGKFSSFLTPSQLEVQINRLVGPAGQLTNLGKIYARGMSMEPAQFAKALQQEATSQFRQAGRVVGGIKPVLKFARPTGGRIPAGPWMETMLGGTSRRVRFFESTSRIAQSYMIYGASHAEVSPLMGSHAVERRIHQMLYPDMDTMPFTGRIKNWRSFLLRQLHDRVPGGRAAIERFAGIPQWETNTTKFLQRMGLEEDIWIPGYARSLEGQMRHAGAFTFDMFRSGWHLLRQQAAFFGHNLGPATNLRQMAGKATKIGAVVYGSILAGKFLNDLTGGKLLDPIYNIYERATLMRARWSDRFGFTEIRKQHPHVYSWSAAAWFGTPLVALAIAKYGHRAYQTTRAEFIGADSTIARLRAGKSVQWQTGATMSRAEQVFKDAGVQAESRLAGMFSRTIDRQTGRVVSAAERVLIGEARVAHQIRPTAWLAVAAWLTVGKLFAPFIFGNKYTEQEQADIFAGKKKVPIRRGRWWEFGSTPYEGGRVAYYRMHQAARRKVRADEEIPGGGRMHPIKSLFDPYWRERESYAARPYPISGTPFEQVPFIGPLLARTLGRFFKPPKLMHTEEFKAGDYYEPFGSDVAPSADLGGLRPARPRDPLGRRALLREFGYKATEFMGLRGFFLQSMPFQSSFGGESPYIHSPVLQPARLNDFTKKYYERELGGMGGFNELFRRLFPRPERGLEINPLQNQMPRWMPGSEYFVNFHEGDPYAKIPYGGERLPGPGYEKLHPELKGMNPEKYPSWARFEILADVAPWSKQYNIYRAVAFKEFGNDPKMRARLDEIEWQVEQVKRRKEFAEYDFNKNLATISGHVAEITAEGAVRLEEYPNHLFRMGGVRMDVGAVSQQLRNINKWTKEKADERAYEQRYDAQNWMTEQLMGKQIEIRAQQGALNKPDVTGIFMSGWTNVNRELVKQGMAAPDELTGRAVASWHQKILGRAVEGLAHMPQKVPGPWFLFSKFMNEASPEEEYRRSILYGTSARFWDKPIKNFIRPYILQTVAKLTPGEFVPGHTKKQREMDQLFDRLEFIKQYEAGNTYKAGRTAVGANVLGSEQTVMAGLPYREKPYLQQFAQETDQGKRERILSMVSGDMQRALVGQWTRQLIQAEGGVVPKPDNRAKMAAAYETSVNDIVGMGKSIPTSQWVGWKPQVQLEDVKAIMVRHEGMDTHDFNIWDDRILTMNQKPYLRGSDEFLTSRPMDRSASILSTGFDRRRQQMTNVSEHISRFRSGRAQIHNQVDRKPEDEKRFAEAQDTLIQVQP